MIRSSESKPICEKIWEKKTQSYWTCPGIPWVGKEKIFQNDWTKIPWTSQKYTQPGQILKQTKNKKKKAEKIINLPNKPANKYLKINIKVLRILLNRQGNYLF